MHKAAAATIFLVTVTMISSFKNKQQLKFIMKKLLYP